MDTTTQIASIQAAITAQTSVVAEAQGILDALNAALTILQQGQQAVTSAIATAQVAALQAQIDAIQPVVASPAQPMQATT